MSVRYRREVLVAVRNWYCGGV